MGKFDEEKKAVLKCAVWLSEHGYFGCFCYILQNHGALSLGSDLDRAWENAELLEKIAQVYYYALATGREISTLPQSTLDYFEKIR